MTIKEFIDELFNAVFCAIGFFVLGYLMVLFAEYFMVIAAIAGVLGIGYIIVGIFLHIIGY